MNINSEQLRKKIQELFPDRHYNLTNETLEELCSDPSSKDFLKWFCSEVSKDNVLTEEEIKIAEHIKKSGKWLEGEQLEAALVEATKENPDLLQILESDVSEEYLAAELALVKLAHKSDEDYLHTLEKGIKNMKKVENGLDEELEKERDVLEKSKIEEKLAYEECLEIMEKYDSIQRKLSEHVEQLVTIYSDASQKKTAPCIWTQLPLDLFIKHMETYYEYLKIYIKKEFGTSTDEPIEGENSASTISTDPDLNLDNTNEKQNQEKKILELRSIHQRLSKAKFTEVAQKARKEATQAMVNHAQKIYNGGEVQIPKTPALMRAEIVELKAKRDNLEKQVSILKEHQVPEAVQKYSNSIINKVLVENAKATQQRREDSIQKLRNLLSLARNHGYLHSDLLYILIELENQKLSEVIEFVSDVRNHLAMEYFSSSKRCDWMQKAQEAISSTRNQNVFNKYFTSMMGIQEGPNSMEIAMEKFSQLLNETESMKETISESMKMNADHLRILDRELLAKYNRQIQYSGDSSLNLDFHIDKTEKNVRNLQAEVLIIRNKLKEMMEKTGSLEREKVILWQKFIADPQSMIRKYDELMAMASQNRLEG
ncbi:augmin complex subunit dgt3 [Belonocnema kinseyi]|uniref:augmin complex subunit dgt3 n=1 Tax=Belonocnema kinseyi TaxID=2817044 RepID=UPI00143E033A|nr:augmin complex subunit dgt3 [Belonocnema kinseyi]XP_033208666.1 augmin complex subunit dgt3 [Belonocnema kinseyi]